MFACVFLRREEGQKSTSRVIWKNKSHHNVRRTKEQEDESNSRKCCLEDNLYNLISDELSKPTENREIQQVWSLYYFSITYVPNIHKHAHPDTHTQCLFNNVWLPFSPLLWSDNYDKTGRGLVISGGTVKRAQRVILHRVSFRTRKEDNKMKM